MGTRAKQSRWSWTLGMFLVAFVGGAVPTQTATGQTTVTADVAVSAARTTVDGQPALEVTVINNGPGDANRLDLRFEFERFQQETKFTITSNTTEDPTITCSTSTCTAARMGPGSSFTVLVTGQTGLYSAEATSLRDDPNPSNNRVEGDLGESDESCPTAKVHGTESDDVLSGTANPESILGLGGNDFLYGLEGNDCLSGGAGDDTLDGKTGSDVVDGDEGNDTVVGGADKDILIGGSGDDLLSDGLGANKFSGEEGIDYIFSRQSIGEQIDCGPDEDWALIDKKDKAKACEHVYRFSGGTLPKVSVKNAEAPRPEDKPAAPAQRSRKATEFYALSNCSSNKKSCYTLFSYPTALRLYRVMKWNNSAQENIKALVKACAQDSVLSRSFRCSASGIGSIALGNAFQAAVKASLRRAVTGKDIFGNPYQGCWGQRRSVNSSGELKIQEDPSYSFVQRGFLFTWGPKSLFNFDRKQTGLSCGITGYVRANGLGPDF